MELCTSSLCARIPKAGDNDAYRPLGIGKSWYRLLGRLVVSPDYAIGGMDMRNAFNSSRWVPTLEGIQRCCPGMVRLFRSAYGRAGILRSR